MTEYWETPCYKSPDAMHCRCWYLTGKCCSCGEVIEKWAKWIRKSNKEEVWIPWGLVATILFIFTAIAIIELPQLILNPEYFALKTILGKS